MVERVTCDKVVRNRETTFLLGPEKTENVTRVPSLYELDSWLKASECRQQPYQGRLSWRPVAGETGEAIEALFWNNP